jgi:hypothetical protein
MMKGLLLQISRRKIAVLPVSWLLLTMSVIACSPSGNEKKLRDCPFGIPEAIFSGQLEGVSHHTFVRDDYASTETLLLADGTEVTLIQRGCEQPEQEFQLLLPPAQRPDESAFWVDAAIRQLQKLSGLSPDLFPLAQWAQAIESQAATFKLGQPEEIQQNTYVKIDRFYTADRVMLLITLGAKP